MRKTAAALIVIACLWIGYTAWPIYDLYVLVRAIETRDVGTITRHVYFDEVRNSITQQLVSTYVRRTGTQISPLARNMAATAVAVADPVMSKLISPEGLADLLSAGWPLSIMPAAPGAVGITRNTLGTMWQVFGDSEYGIGRFEISAPAALPPQHRFYLEFRLLQWQWRLVGVTLPERIQDVLADEIAKTIKRPH